MARGTDRSQESAEAGAVTPADGHSGPPRPSRQGARIGGFWYVRQGNGDGTARRETLARVLASAGIAKNQAVCLTVVNTTVTVFAVRE